VYLGLFTREDAMSLRIPAAALALLLCGACSSSRPAGRSVFHFQVDSTTYEVISLSLASGEGVNYLLRREGDEVVFRARDDDQDGRIDQVLIGDESLRTADSLYALGIEEAKRRGQFAKREASRVFVVSREDGVYSIRSVMLGPSSWYNAFIVSDPAGSREVFLLDSDADGVLDPTELGDASMRHWQSRYREMLEEGIRSMRVERTLSGYVVL
jgi:hypothetical protein